MSFRKPIVSLPILALVIFTILINGAVILAQAAPLAEVSPRQAENSVVVEQGPMVTIPPLTATLTSTVYLPHLLSAPAVGVPSDCNPTGGSGGFAPGTYETVVAELNAIVVVGANYQPEQPTLLVFNIHGDGGNYDGVKKANHELNQVTNEYGWILISPQAPNGNTWWREWVGDHNEKLADAFDEMFEQYNVCRDIILGTTGSGGSEFYTSYFFPAKGGEYPAHMLIACGGSAGHNSTSRNQILQLGKDAGVVAKSSFYYVYGSEDGLRSLIESSIELYTRAGFEVTSERIEGAGHCNKWSGEGRPTWPELAAAYWAELAEQLNQK